MSRYSRTTYSSIGYPRWTRAVKILIISCVITFLVQAVMERTATNTFGQDSFTSTFALTPWKVIHNGAVWQLVTYIFLHANLLHILFNMLGLWMFGSELEQVWGTRQFTRFFFACGIGAGIAMVAVFLLFGGDPRVSTIGASGSVYGVLLAFAMLFPDRIIYWLIFPIPAKYFVMILGGLAFFSSISASSSGVAHVAHLGGMLCGYIYMKARGMSRRHHSHRRRISTGVKDWYGKWQRRRLRRKFDVYYNQRHGNGRSDEPTDDDKWRRWKN